MASRPKAGQIFRNPDLARTFRAAETGRAPTCSIRARSPARSSPSRRQLGGTMTLEDLANYKGEWVEPARTTYHGYDISNCPRPRRPGPPTRSSTSCRPACRNGRQARRWPRSARPIREYWHLLVEAKKLAYADLFRYNADPDFVPGAARSRLLSSRTLRRCARGGSAAMPPPTGPPSDEHGTWATPSCCRLRTGTATWCRG